MKGLSYLRIATKVDVTRPEKIYCLKACPCIFQPGTFAGWGSERVNISKRISPPFCPLLLLLFLLLFRVYVFV